MKKALVKWRPATPSTGAKVFAGDDSWSNGNMKATQTWTAAQSVTYEKVAGVDDSYSLCGDTGKYFQGVSRTRAL